MANTVYVHWSETTVNAVSRTLQRSVNNSTWEVIKELDVAEGVHSENYDSPMPETLAYRTETKYTLFGKEIILHAPAYNIVTGGR